VSFESGGYHLTFIQKEGNRDESAHLYSLIFKFFSPHTNFKYIVRADYHECDVFAIKFYVDQQKRSDYKYSIITNKGDTTNIIVTCAKVVPLLLVDYPNASFAFAGSRSIDKVSNKIESYYQTQRFVIYRDFAARFFGVETFEHFEYAEISSYLLLNKGPGRIEDREKRIRQMFIETYNTLLDLT
jgi:hypothetical protein